VNTFLIGVLIVGLATIVSALGPIFMKRGAERFSLNPRKFLKDSSVLFKNWGVILGCLFFGTSAVIFVVALRYGELSVLYPITSLSYIWACLLSIKFLNERMNAPKWAGIFAILIGVALIGLGRSI
jgi:uncharacterized membrane protein